MGYFGMTNLSVIRVSSGVIRKESKQEQRDKEGNDGVNKDL